MFGLSARRSLFARLSRRLHIGQVGDQAQLALQKSVTKSLRDVVHSKSGHDIVYTGLLKSVEVRAGGIVSLTLGLDEQYRALRAECIRIVSALPGVSAVRVHMESVKIEPAANKAGAREKGVGGLADVKTIVAVSSCKGGVGKSTVAVNLAYALAQKDLKVGIFDADIHGPSLPTLVSPVDTTLRELNFGDLRLVQPPVYEGVKCMSYGFVRPKDAAPVNKLADPVAALFSTHASSAAIMRGPMVSNIVNQLLRFTAWGELDYLIIDMPPGTGDIQITLSQQFAIDAALIVSTPQKLSFIDVVKGIDMFDKVNIPTVGVVENMAYFKCGSCDAKHYPFGSGYRRQVSDLFGIRNSFELPLDAAVARQSDAGDPLVLDHSPKTAEVRAVYSSIADAVHTELVALKSRKQSEPVFGFDEKMKMVTVQTPSGQNVSVAAAALRRACKCARCVDEMSGEQLLQPDSVKSDIKPVNMKRRGNYAVAIDWSDGHTSSIYPYAQIVTLAAAGTPL